jgi:glycosyltransferase involved in cell wall biosynthesis
MKLHEIGFSILPDRPPCEDAFRMTAPTPACAIVVPCYNEADRLPQQEFIRFAREHPEVFFVFANDGSKDNTSQMLEALRQNMPAACHVLDNAVNQGKAGVVRQGLLWAIDETQAPVLGFWDADLATPLDSILEMLEVLRNKPDCWMVFGARVKLLGREIERKPHRHYLGRVFATFASTLLRLPVYDTQCGAKLFRRTPQVRSLFAEPFVSRWIFDVEIIARFLRLPASQRPTAEAAIYELPLRVWKDIGGSKVKPRDFLKAIADLWRIRNRYGL